MPSKTERIISYLPDTFSAFPKPSALHSVIDAFGNELLLAENSLAAVMSSHWVDRADVAAELINDLGCFARLYGLAPRGAAPKADCGPLSSEESVEEFREHLKRFVRTFLEGTVTVQGILRVVAESLSLRIADDYDALDPFWTRAVNGLTTIDPRGDDAASALFGVTSATVNGAPARAAEIQGNRDLSSGTDLGNTSVLRLKVDNAAPVEIDLGIDLGKTVGLKLDEITEAINKRVGTIASHNNHYLILTSKTMGPSSLVQVQDTNHDAATLLLGLAPHVYHGTEAARAQLTSLIDLSGGVDLSESRFLRLLIDGKLLEEIDCAGANASNTKLQEITEAINQAFVGLTIASHDGHFLRLVSPTLGANGSVAFQTAAAQDARDRLFGFVPVITSGNAPKPAEVIGSKDLSQGIDLSLKSSVRVRLDGQPAIIVNCAGANPSNTRLDEIVTALSVRLGANSAFHDGRFVHLLAPTSGPSSSIAFELLPANEDATEIIFGIRPREVRGAAATRAQLIGKQDLSEGFDAAALNVIRIALDQGEPVEVNVLNGAADNRAMTLAEISRAINRGLSSNVASDDGQHLILTSSITGGSSQIAIEPLLVKQNRQFVTRAYILDEASQAAFGFIVAEAQGKAATKAQVTGQADLSRGVDLRDASFLRVAVDDGPGLDIDCSGIRPRATTLKEIVDAINAKLGGNVATASLDGQNLVLTSPIAGAGSRIAIEPPRAVDAVDLLFGLKPQSVFGRDPTRVNFVGTVDLSSGIDLSLADRIKLSIDDESPQEMSCANPNDAAHTLLSDIVLAINLKLGKIIANHDGKHLILTSQLVGENSKIEFSQPDGADATKAIFGIQAPRKYHGTKAAPAQIIGNKELGETDLRISRLLTLAINSAPPVEVDCAAGAADAARATLAEITQAINDLLKINVASHDGKHLILTSTQTGGGSQVQLLESTGKDATTKLLGDVAPETPDTLESTARPTVAATTKGSDDAPAVIEGKVELVTLLDLSQRQTIRVSIDGGLPIEINIAGPKPGITSLNQIVTQINAVYPRLASSTEEGHLRLTSPTRGEESKLSLLPVRVLELIEYPRVEASDPPSPFPQTANGGHDGSNPPRRVRHGDSWFVDNQSVSDSELKIEMSAPQGTVGAELLNSLTRQRVRLMAVIRPGERALFDRGPESEVRVVIESSDGTQQLVPPEQILIGPFGAQVHIPFAGEHQLSDGSDNDAATLQLNNPRSKVLTLLRSRIAGAQGNSIKVSVAEAKLDGSTPPVETNGEMRLIGKLLGDQNNPGGFRLVDSQGSTLARLRAGAAIALDVYLDRAVAVTGTLYPEHLAPLMVVRHIGRLFDVGLHYQPSQSSPPRSEQYKGVLIGAGEDAAQGLVWQVNRGPEASHLVSAREVDKSPIFTLPVGRSSWNYLDCYGARFNHARFDKARFAGGGRCADRAVFNFSRFTRDSSETETTVFASATALPDPPVEIRFRWSQHQPGAFVVNLPVDLPDRFGGRFNRARFGLSSDSEERFEEVFTEPETDQNHLIKRINDGPKKVKGNSVGTGSVLIKAEKAERVPLSFEVVTIPFRRPRALTGGTDREPAQMYLTEKDIPGLIKISARESGGWGNSITVAVLKSGPARFDVIVSYAATRFESARLVAQGGEQLPALTEEILRPGPVGVLQAKAAGVKAQVSRGHAQSTN